MHAREVERLPRHGQRPHLRLKSGVVDVSESVLRAMDQAIPSPILFEIQGESGIRVAAAYKRPNEADAGKCVLGDYLRGDWQSADTPRQPLPVALDMTGLYRELLRGLIPLPPRAGEGLRQQLERLSAERAAARECRRLENQLNGEGQFNRKVEFNRLLCEARRVLQEARCGSWLTTIARASSLPSSATESQHWTLY